MDHQCQNQVQTAQGGLRGVALSRRALVGGAAALGGGLAAFGPAGGGRAAGFRSETRFALRQTDDSGTFTALLARGLPDLDPHSAYDGVASSVIIGVYETLITLKGTSTTDYAPALAREWSANADETEWTFTLGDGITFHDGSVCDAEAAVASFRRLLNLQMGPFDVLGRFVASPDDIIAVDPLRVRFTLKSAHPLFLAAMSSQYGPLVVSPTAVAANATDDDPLAHNWLLANMVGTGPYRVVELEPSERVVLERFDNYHGGWDDRHFSGVVFRVVPDTNTRRQLIESGDADGLVNTLTPEAKEDMKNNPAVQVLEYPTTAVAWATFNCGAQLADPDARQGLSYAFPYAEVRQGVMRGLYEATGGPLTPRVRGYDPNILVYETDLDRAKTLLDGTVGAGATFSWMIAADNELSAAIAQLFQANLQQIGYDLAIEAIDQASLIDLAYGVTDPADKPDAIGDWSWFPDYNDAYNQIAPNFQSDGGSNIGFYANDRVDEILATLAPGVAGDAYDDLAAEAQALLTEQDPPAIFMGAKRYYTVLGADIRGFAANPIYLEGYNLYEMSREG